MAMVPNLVGKQIQGNSEAQDATLAAHLTMGTATGHGHTGTGAVTGQSLTVGSSVPDGTAINVDYSRDDTQPVVVWGA